MERRGYPKPKITRGWGFRVQYQDRGYECTESNGSLKPGKRQDLYCPGCDAEECVWGGPTFKQIQAGAEVVNEKRVISGARRELYSRAAKLNVRQKRAQGLTPSGIPLAEVCYNCVHMRQDHFGFLCKFRLLDDPVTEWTMRQRYADRFGCTSFAMRLVMELGRLGDDG